MFLTPDEYVQESVTESASATPVSEEKGWFQSVNSIVLTNAPDSEAENTQQVSIRQSNFKQYVDSLSKMIPLFFAMNHTNYARWLPVHLLDMRRLHKTAPYVASKFEEGFFTVHKSSRHFPCMAIDQAHEQNNAIVKGEGGAVGLMENQNALRRWMVSSPELARLVNEFEVDMNGEANHQIPVTAHHEVYKSFQTSFLKDVKALVTTMEELGNPFFGRQSGSDRLRYKRYPWT
jgi:hypothetical protein